MNNLINRINMLSSYTIFTQFNLTKNVFQDYVIIISLLNYENNHKIINKYGPFTQYNGLFYVLNWELKDTKINKNSDGLYTISYYYQDSDESIKPYSYSIPSDYINNEIICVNYILKTSVFYF